MTPDSGQSSIDTALLFSISTPFDLGGIAKLREALVAVDEILGRIRAGANGQASAARASVAEIQRVLKTFNNLKPTEAVNALVKEFQSGGKLAGSKMSAEILGRLDLTGSKAVQSAAKNARTIATAYNREFARIQKTPSPDSLAGIFNAAASAGSRVSTSVPITAAPPAGAVMSSSGSVFLSVPPDRIRAVLADGNIHLTVDPNRVKGSAGGTDGGGSGGGGSGTGGGKRGKGGAGDDGDGPVGAIPTGLANEIRRRTVEAGKTIRDAVTTLENDLKVTRTYRRVEGGGKLTSTVTEDPRAGNFSRAFATRVSEITTERLRKLSMVGGSRVDRLLGRAAQTEMLSDQLRQFALSRQNEARVLGESLKIQKVLETAAKVKLEANRLLEQATTEEARLLKLAANQQARVSKDNARGVARYRSAEARGNESAESRRNARDLAREDRRMAGVRSGQSATLVKAAVSAAESRMAELSATGFKMSESRSRALKRGGQSGIETFTFTKEEGGQKFTEQVKFFVQGSQRIGASMTQSRRELRATREELGNMGSDFAKNTAKVTTWAASVGILYGTINLARRGMQAYIETSYQQQRLEAVFNGVGGTARALTDDVIRLAAAEGRAGQEAIDSAVQWARLGLTRSQVNQAVKVSLQAANVAEIDTAEATQYLQATMAAYRLEVSELAGVLGRLNAVSNTFNVSNKDLFLGLSRTASVASEAGVGLSELIGMIGAGVGTTGQSGANVGNAIKSILVSIGNPATQKYLKDAFNLDTADARGELKSLSTVLADLFVKYEQLGRAEQQSLLFNVAGKTQASRLAALLDSYVRSQVLAINAQLNLNSAEKENAQIRETLRSQLQTLVTELERFAYLQGRNGPGAVLASLAEGVGNVVNVMNLPVISQGITGLIGLLTVMGARLALTRLQMDRLSESPGFVARSINGVSAAYAGLKREVSGMADTLATRTRGGPMARLGNLPAAGIAALTGFGRASRLTELRGVRAVRAGSFVGGTASQVAGLAGRGVAATGMLAAGGVAAAAGMLPQLLVVTLAVIAASKGLSVVLEALGRTSTGADSRMAKLNDEMERGRAAAGAATLAARLYDTVTRNLATGRNRADSRAAVGLLGTLNRAGSTSLAPPKAVLDQIAGMRDEGQIRALLKPYRDAAIQEAVRQTRAARDAQLDRVVMLRGEVGRLESKAPAFRDESLLAAKRRELSEAEGQAVKSTLSYSDDLVEANRELLGLDRERTRELERQRLVFESIESIVHGFAGASPQSRSAATIAALQGRLDVIKGEIASVEGPADRAEMMDREREQIEDQITELKTRVDANRFIARNDADLDKRREADAAIVVDQRKIEDLVSRSNAADFAVQPVDMRAAQSLKNLVEQRKKLEDQLAAQEKAQREVGALNQANYLGGLFGSATAGRYGVGRNETEKLLDIQNGAGDEGRRLDRMIAAEKDLAAQTRLRSESGRLILASQEATVRLLEREVSIEREARQSRLDKNKAFAESFVGASADQRLNKLMALQLTSGGRKFSIGELSNLGELGSEIGRLPGQGFDDREREREQRLLKKIAPRENAQSQLAEGDSILERQAKAAAATFAPFIEKLGRAGDAVDRTVSGWTARLDEMIAPGGSLSRFDTGLGQLADKIDAIVRNQGGGGGIPRGRTT